MSGPDEGMLTAQERAALASLEARASADDPRLAAQLRAAQPRRTRRVPQGRPAAAGAAAAVIASWWGRLTPILWGPLLTVAGLAVAVLGLAVSLVLSVAGVLLAAAGIGLLAQLGAVRLHEAAREAGRDRPGPRG